MSTHSLPAVHQILALDVGQKRIGVARAQSQTRLAEALEVVEAGEEREFADLQRLIDAWQPAVLVVGLPLGNRGQETAQTLWTKAWVELFLSRVDFKGRLVYQDEFLSTRAARERRPLKDRGAVDDLAACIILDDYLETQPA